VKTFWRKPKPRVPEYDPKDGVRFEVRVFHEAEVVICGYLDDLILETETFPVSYDVTRLEYIPVGRTFTLKGRVRPWKEKDRDRTAR